MSIFVLSSFQVLSMFFLSGGMGIPLGIPPAAEDPVLARIAPRECLFYVTWSGMSTPDPQSRNQTEQLLAEKEVQQSLKLLEEQIVASFRTAAADDPQAAAMVDNVRTVAKAVLTSATAIFISKVQLPKNGPPDVRGGAIVNLGDRAPEIAKALGRIESLLQGVNVPKPDGGSAWHRVPLGMHDPAADRGGSLLWAVKGRYLIIGLGEGEAEKIVERARQEQPEWLRQLRQQLAVPRPANLIYVNVAGLLKIAVSVEPELSRIIEGLGLAQVQSLASITGLDESSCISRTQVAIDGDLKGLLSVLTTQPLAKEHLTAIPKDATIALVARLDVAKVYKELLEIVGRLEPRGQQELLGGVRQIEERLKVKLYEDILQSLGDVWRVYTSPSEGNLVFTGLTAVVDIRDHDRLVAANAKLVFGSLFGGMAKEVTQPGRGQPEPQIKQIKYGEQTIFYLTRLGDFTPFSPAWCITDKKLVVALFPQNVKAYLERAGQIGAPSLADVAALTEPFEAAKPIAVSYLDTPAAFKLVYPIVQVALGFASRQMGRGGLGLDISMLPPAPSIGRHLRPTVTTVSRTKEGIVVETHQTLSIGGVSGLTILPSMLMFRSSGPMRVSALPKRVSTLPTQQNISSNNLKMLGLALLNYEATYAAFPSAAAGQKPNQPPVSWRVLILPYVEQSVLYQQYRFDEPWDSENNKKLIDRMPDVFKTPGSRKAVEGKTNYLAVVGEPYALAADKGRRMSDFADGTSNTILLVEASDERAVPWTKPEDFTPDKTKPAAGLVGLRQGLFLVLTADGAVRVLPADIGSSTIGSSTLHALFTRAGGEVAEFPVLGAASAVAEPTVTK
ncbi:MAG: DUF1559 domain-containing protein [Planctomycetota bacterium]